MSRSRGASVHDAAVNDAVATSSPRHKAPHYIVHKIRKLPNELQHHQRKSKPRPLAICTENLRTFWHAVPEIIVRTDRQTDRLRDRHAHHSIPHRYRGGVKLKFHESSSSHQHPRRICHEDATRMLATCPQQVGCVSYSWNSENDTTHGQTGSTIHRSRQPADQSGKRVTS